MIKSIRSTFNEEFSETKYSRFLSKTNSSFDYQVPFRIAESPVFVDAELKDKLLNASEKIIDFINEEGFSHLTKEAIPDNLKDRKNIGRPVCLAIDFAITRDEQDKLSCELIELQGAMSLYGFTELIASIYKDTYNLPSHYTPYLSRLNAASYIDILKKEFLGNHKPENVVLLEIYPARQQNRLDFLYLEKALGIKTVCVSELIKENNKLFYYSNNEKIPIFRIINRTLVEELDTYPELSKNFYFEDDLNVEWINHPAWFFRISKFILPFLKGDHFPESKFLTEFDPAEDDLDDFVLKPLYSCGGKGVDLDITLKSIEDIKEKNKFIIQQKVKYDHCVLSPVGAVKAEIRLMYIWEESAVRPIPVITLARLTRGDKMALRYNSQGMWVGASVCLFEQ